ncbi:MAG: helix-turn-helix transcriptional regulator [Clostridia bacterium]|nr:helix-turn-helix transcriptional regulator [Clostridia bacterium]
MPKKKRDTKLCHHPYDKFMAFLKENRIKLQEIADLFGHTVQTISMKNHGKSDYSMSEVDKICNHLGISSEIFRAKKVS